MNFHSLKRSLVSVIKNLPGKSVGRKILVIEADDWGSIRMPSKQAFATLASAGIPVERSRYGKFDALESSEDLESLFEVLTWHKDKKGNNAVISPFCNMANPDFQRIREKNYFEYAYETFTETYQRYSRNGIMNLWQQGVDRNIFVPEYHGREHISTDLWLKALRSGDTKVKAAFENEYVAYSPVSFPKLAKDFRPSYFIESDQSLGRLKSSLEDGIDIFQESFGFLPTIFNAPNAVFVPSLNPALISKGIKFNAVPKKRLDRTSTGTYEHFTYSTGQRSAEGITYYVRNCNFEPSDPSYRGIGHVLSQIQGAFFCGKAAIVGTHRVNFVGGLDESNRRHGLSELDDLLTAVLKRWPEVEFMSSKEFTSLL
ncbi:hypothetical protein [Desertivirga brevis]|uniref:hypothetical protein n=1 Tax=Desertivirga brevis TaxID=2810310 RepID=UPI001A968D07|nr:hypothetical protein [Pedobacter sp. SYSU D00873]